MGKLKNFLRALRSFRAFIVAFYRKFFPESRTNSIKFQISVLYTAILGIILIVFSGVLYIILSRSLYVEPDYTLKQKAQEISQTVRTYMDIRGEDPGALDFAVKKTIAPDTVKLSRWWMVGFDRRWFERLDKLDLSRDYINFVGYDGVSIARSKTVSEELLDIFKQNFQIPKEGEVGLRTITYNKKQLRLINQSFTIKDGHKYIIQLAVPPSPTALLLQNWLRSMLISIPVVLFLTSFFGRMFSKRILAPLNDVIATARTISHEDLSARVPSKQFAIEMTGLVDAFNEMIGRLEKSFQHIEDFSSKVAHELKTPLSIIKGESEIALRRDRDPEEYKRTLVDTLEESDRMLKIIEDLLLLTKLNYQPDVFRFEKIDFTGFFSEIYEQTRMLAEQKKIMIKLSMPQQEILIKADQLHLRRLFFNLIDNAVKVTPPGKSIYLMVKCQKDDLSVSIIDTGVGIAESSIPKIFEKFSHLNMRASGTGLGLSIALSIAKLHKGDIRVTSTVGEGSTFEVVLPLVKEPPGVRNVRREPA